MEESKIKDKEIKKLKVNRNKVFDLKNDEALINDDSFYNLIKGIISINAESIAYSYMAHDLFDDYDKLFEE